MFVYLTHTGCTDAPPIWWDSATPLLSYLCSRYGSTHFIIHAVNNLPDNYNFVLEKLSPAQNVDKWSFDVFALNEASGDHALKFIFYELLTRYDLISRFKVKTQG